MNKINRLDEARKLYTRLSMDVKRLIRIIKFKFGAKEIIYDNWVFENNVVEVIMDKNYTVTICSYDKERNVYIVLMGTTTDTEC